MQFTLPDGHQCYGLVMEFIEGKVIPEAELGCRSEDEQIKFVRGAPPDHGHVSGRDSRYRIG